MTPEELRARKVGTTYRLFRTLAITHGLRCQVFLVNLKRLP